MFKENLNSREARVWLMRLEELLRVIDCTKELLRVMDCTEEQRVKYSTYKFSREVRGWCYAKRNSLVMELRSEKAITWT